MFNRETYSIYVPKEQIGESPYSTESPRTQMTSNAQAPLTRQNAVVGAIAFMAVSRAAQGIKTEMEATARNRGTVKRINAASKFLAYGAAFKYGGLQGLALQMAADTVMGIVEHEQTRKQSQRFEQDKAFERTLKGAKATFGMGGSAYD